ncbi:acyl-CoA carboxylase subunit epsilon [Streptomyces sp. NBC_00091]|uniref:acyl-CoA carboxylase subunit epsilon n=1 Tax=Streptomyces sp. NBC_00091 TaxID=2975648 RepID=UPI002254FC93|nr:acyl-CoA carboxylase subunit epsilon [Streptomyces sp. NBC_00091]MCX5381206.1 acyl-CoA carboxylase subunit epsilon [Streptomyces sp. NBC_00091]
METRVEPGQLIRVVKGRPDTAELAALTAVVLARAAAYEGQHGGTAGGGPALAGWRCPQQAGGFQGPRTWQERRSA